MTESFGPTLLRVCIFGSRGFVGRHVFDHLSASPARYEIKAMTSAELDLRDTSAVQAFFQSQKRFDVVIHSSSTGGSRLTPDDANTLQDNLRMYDNVARLAEDFGMMIFFSSGAALTQHGRPYGFSKYLIEQINRAQHPSVYLLRIFGAFGPGELEQRFVSSCLRNKAAGKPAQVHSDIRLDNVYIGDICLLVERYIEAFVAEGPNITSLPKLIDCGYTVKKRLSEVARMITDDVAVQNDGVAGADYVGKGRLEDYISCVGLEEGIRRTAEAFEQQCSSLA